MERLWRVFYTRTEAKQRRWGAVLGINGPEHRNSTAANEAVPPLKLNLNFIQ